jgi:hypothetical protein
LSRYSAGEDTPLCYNDLQIPKEDDGYENIGGSMGPAGATGATGENGPIGARVILIYIMCLYIYA